MLGAITGDVVGPAYEFHNTKNTGFKLFLGVSSFTDDSVMTAAITHNHPEGIKGAQSTAAAIFLARTGKTKEEIRDYIEKTYGYDLHKTLSSFL